MIRPKPYALLDLVEAKMPAVQRDFVTKATQLANDVGGRLALANKVLPPIIIPDDRETTSENNSPESVSRAGIIKAVNKSPSNTAEKQIAIASNMTLAKMVKSL